MGSLSLWKALAFLTWNKLLEKLGLDEMQIFNSWIYILKYNMVFFHKSMCSDIFHNIT